MNPTLLGHRGFLPLPPPTPTVPAAESEMDQLLSAYLGLAEWDDVAELVRTRPALWSVDCLEELVTWPRPLGGDA